MAPGLRLTPQAVLALTHLTRVLGFRVPDVDESVEKEAASGDHGGAVNGSARLSRPSE